jgi:hypothetical protein
MVHVSQTVNKKAKNYKKEFTPEEQSLLPFLPEFLVDSFKKGIEEGMEKGMEKVLLHTWQKIQRSATSKLQITLILKFRLLNNCEKN